MGIADDAVPRFFWKYDKGGDNASDNRKILWGSVVALRTMASQPQNPPERAVVAAAVPSTVARLCVRDVAGIKVRGLDGMQCKITSWDEEVNCRAYSKGVGPWALRWV